MRVLEGQKWGLERGLSSFGKGTFQFWKGDFPPVDSAKKGVFGKDTFQFWNGDFLFLERGLSKQK